MSMSSKLRAALEAFDNSRSNVTPTQVCIVGVPSTEASVQKLTRKLRIPVVPQPSRISQESQQENEKLKQDALLSLFVFKPKQTGYAAVAEMTASAINNPAHTAILALTDDDETLDARIDREAMLEILTNAGAPVFNDSETAAQYINDLAGESTEESLEIVN
jgi:hypothetical protein